MAINPFRKGGTDTIPVSEGGTGAVTAPAALSNLGALDSTAHALINHTGIPGVGGGSGVPAGTVVDFAGVTPPSGWLECDGTSFTTAAEPTLFAAIGYTWGGAGPNFSVPDLRRRATAGRGGAGTGTLGNAVGNTGGAETHVLSLGELAAHNHSENTHSHSVTLGNLGMYVTPTSNGNSYLMMTGTNTGNSQSLFGSTSSSAGSNNNSGSGTAHNNIQPTAVVMKIIKT